MMKALLERVFSRAFLFYSVIVLSVLNMVDVVITVVGVHVLGYEEANPLFSGMVGTGVLWFIVIKTLISFWVLWTAYFFNKKFFSFDSRVVKLAVVLVWYALAVYFFVLVNNFSLVWV